MEENLKHTDKSEPWNIAKGYVTLKVLSPLIENDKLVNMALYGCDNIDAATAYPVDVKILNRLEGIKRLHTNLEKIYSNAYFAIKKKDITKFEGYKTGVLDVIEKSLPTLSNISEDQRNKAQEITIDEELFTKCLDMLRKMMLDMNVELNNANLIFPSSEETDIEAIKEELIHGGV